MTHFFHHSFIWLQSFFFSSFSGIFPYTFVHFFLLSRLPIYPSRVMIQFLLFTLSCICPFFSPLRSSLFFSSCFIVHFPVFSLFHSRIYDSSSIIYPSFTVLISWFFAIPNYLSRLRLFPPCTLTFINRSHFILLILIFSLSYAFVPSFSFPCTANIWAFRSMVLFSDLTDLLTMLLRKRYNQGYVKFLPPQPRSKAVQLRNMQNYDTREMKNV